MARRTSRRSAVERDFHRALHREFLATINMTAAQIRRWHASPLSKLASFARTRAELLLLADMKATPVSAWTSRMWGKAQRAVSFVKRHEAQMRAQGRRYGSGRLHITERRVVALLNWGRLTPGVALAKQLLAG